MKQKKLISDIVAEFGTIDIVVNIVQELLRMVY